jgi:hypothetical protein
MSLFGNIEVQSNFDMGGGDFESIPSGTQLRGLIESAEIGEYEDQKYINIKWRVLGGEYDKRIIFQKVRVFENDEKKRDKALAMLAAIDLNCGGNLNKKVQSVDELDDIILMSCLANKQMYIKVAVWEMGEKKGNWVKEVSAAGEQATPTKNFDDDIDF